MYGQVINIQEVNSICENLGEYLSFNSFFIYKSSDIHKFCLTNSKNTRPYANIKYISYFSEEDEIFIGLGSIFKIKEIFYDENQQIWHKFIKIKKNMILH